jgi:hypothetical protein
MVLDIHIVNTLAKLLNVEAREIIAQPLKAEILVSDTTQKISISTSKNALPKAFVLISAKNTPGAIKSGYEKLCGLAEIIGPALTKNLLMPLKVDMSNGLTYSISTFHKPLSSKRLLKKLDVWRVRRHLIDWVIAVAKASKVPASNTEIEERFVQPLLKLSQAQGLKPKHQKIALEAVNAIKNGSWQPSFVCAHNDLWWGNVLSSKQYKFVLIDWDGVMLKGYAFYDLVRAAGSFGLKKSAFKRALTEYCRVMQCDETQANYYLISSFASFYSDLGGWQYERFIMLLNYCMEYSKEHS